MLSFFENQKSRSLQGDRDLKRRLLAGGFETTAVTRGRGEPTVAIIAVIPTVATSWLHRVAVIATIAASWLHRSAVLFAKPSIHDGDSSDLRIRLECFDHDLRDFALQKALDVIEQLVLVNADERSRTSNIACASCTTNAVDVIFRNTRQVVVDHVGQIVDVQPTCRDIGGDEDTDLSLFELSEGL